MIPVSLSLHNFMCYRDNVPTLSFKGIHTACISGDNGNGKSTLVDAITWALWGKTRARGDDDLIHLGQTETEVVFDFAVGEQVYRIIRKHARSKKSGGPGRTILELQISGENGFRSITGNTISQTQQAIIDVVHMDYQTFVNSALLLQGHADSFTVKRPLERKQVLADILRLSFYDELVERAKNRVREKELVKSELEGSIRVIRSELEKRSSWQAELEEKTALLVDMDKKNGEKKAFLEEIRQKKEALENKRRYLEQLEKHINSTNNGLSRWIEQSKKHQRRIDEFQELLDRRDAIERGYQEWNRARQLNDELNHKLGLVKALSERKHDLEMDLAQNRQSLLKEYAVVQNRLEELDSTGKGLALLKEELNEERARSRSLQKQQELMEKKKRSYREVVADLNRLESSGSHLEQGIKEIEEKLKLLRTKQGTRCPLCETELNEDGMKLIESKYDVDKKRMSDSLKRNREQLSRKKGELGKYEEEIERLETELNREVARNHKRLGYLNQEVSRAEQARAGVKKYICFLADIEERLAGKDYAPAEQKALEEVKHELAKLDYSEGRHQEVRQQLSGMQHYQELKIKVDEAARFIKAEKEAAQYADASINELRGSLEDDYRKKKAMDEELAQLPQITAELNKSQAEYESLLAEQKEAQQEQWSIKEKLKRCSELDIKVAEKEKLYSVAAGEEGIFQELVQAFGKRGIQALLIESAIPEIEVEANKLLSHMTDNRMHVKMETQRATRSGGTVETLDIKISDELGTRSYEMFSGGEAFRINFAIRIALSRLLARRAGAPLPTLVIDEGFGTQDNTGIGKIKEAISSIQDDFEKILVITHMEELRDAFPNRIEVRKTGAGSTLEVI